MIGLAPLSARIRGLLRYGDKMSLDFIASCQPEERGVVQGELNRMFHNGTVDCTPYSYGRTTKWFLR